MYLLDPRTGAHMELWKHRSATRQQHSSTEVRILAVSQSVRPSVSLELEVRKGRQV